jgi:hypothetical protein
MRTSNVDANWLDNLGAAEHDPDYLSDIKNKYQIVLDGIIKLNSFAEKARDSERIVFIDYLRELITALVIYNDTIIEKYDGKYCITLDEKVRQAVTACIKSLLPFVFFQEQPLQHLDNIIRSPCDDTLGSFIQSMQRALINPADSPPLLTLSEHDLAMFPKPPQQAPTRLKIPRVSVIAVLGLSLVALTAVTLFTHGAILPFMPIVIKAIATALGAPMISATACHSIGLGLGLFCTFSSIAWTTHKSFTTASNKTLAL